MKRRKLTRSHFRSFVLAALLLAGIGVKLDAAVYVSNLTNRFDGGIGPGSSLFPGGGALLAIFTTGAGSYSLNSVALEFLACCSGPDPWTNVNADLFQTIGGQPLPIVPLGQPTINPMPTQWPQSTLFIDFHPNWQTTLQPFTQYQIVLRVPVENQFGAGLIFSSVTNYASLDSWQMAPPAIGGWLLKLAVDATFVQDEFTYTNFNYSTNNGALTIVSYGGSGGAVSIPDTVYGMPVVSIGQAAFSNRSDLLSVTIPTTVTSIENAAFISCSSLADLLIPASVTNLGSSVFQSCSSLTNLGIGAGVQAIGDSAFDFCSNLTTITVDPFNPAYSSLGGVLLNQAQTMVIRYPEGKTGSYTIPTGITNVAKAAFANCRITDVIIAGTVASLGNGAFAGCTNLPGITIPGSVTSIGDTAFANCARLTSVCFRGDVPASGSLVFDGDHNVTVYYLPGTMGWTTNFAGRPAWLWNPVIITRDGMFGLNSNQFAFNITGTPSLPVLIEATTNLAQASWVPLQTIRLTNGLFFFQDSNWTSYPARIYRIRSP